MRIPIAFRLPGETIALIRAISEQCGMTQTRVLEFAVRAYAKAKKVEPPHAIGK